MNKEQIIVGFKQLGLDRNLSIDNLSLKFVNSGVSIETELNPYTWETTFTATLKETTEAGESVKATLTTLREKLQIQLGTLDGMLAKYDEVKE